MNKKDLKDFPAGGVGRYEMNKLVQARTVVRTILRRLHTRIGKKMTELFQMICVNYCKVSKVYKIANNKMKGKMKIKVYI